MNILFIHSFYWPDQIGGAERSVKRLADLHTKAGDQVSVLTTHAGPGIKVDQVDGVTVYRIPPHNIYWGKQPDQPSGWKRLLWHGLDSFNLKSYLDARKVIREVKPDVISCHNLAGLSASIWLAARRAGIPIVQVLRDYYTICPKSTMHKAGRNCQKQCASCKAFRLPHKHLSNQLSAVVGCSNAVLQKHLTNGLYEHTPTKRVIYNAEPIRPLAKQKAPAGKTFTFGYIGAITEVKGVENLLQAFLLAQEKSKTAIRMVVAGSGPESYVQFLRSKYTSPDITFIGHTNPTAFFAQVDVSIASSVWDDPLPGVVFQALAHGVPVIGAQRGGIPEMVQDGVNGLLYDPDDPAQLIGCMVSVADSRELLERLSGNTAISTQTFTDEQRLLTEYTALYSHIINELSVQKSERH